MKLELSIAADGGLVVRSPQPISGAPPAPSSAVRPATPLRDTGSCAPTRAHAIPSSSRYLARTRTGSGISSKVVSASQVASRPVGPPGSLAGRPGLPSSLSVGIVTVGAWLIIGGLLSFADKVGPTGQFPQYI